MTLLYAELRVSDGGRRVKGSVANLAWDFGVNKSTVFATYGRIRHGKTVFRKPRIYNDNLMDSLENHLALIEIVVDAKGRLSKRRMAAKFFRQTGVNISADTLVRHLKTLKVEVCRRRYCPQLTEVHKVQRYVFGSKYNEERWKYWLDVDEKWFYVVRVKGFVWVLPGYMNADDVKSIPVQSKRYITKVMFLVAIARPVYSDSGECLFDGKVGCWRVCDIRKRTQNYNGKRVKYNKDDLYTLDVSLGAKKYVEMLETLLLPRLKVIKRTVWDVQAAGTDYKVRIQHDGAPGHRAEGIEAKLEALYACICGEFVRQPPKSPDCNMLDMAVFNSMAHLVARCDYRTKSQLCAAVQEAWLALPLDTLEMQWSCKSVVMRLYTKFLGGLAPSLAKHVGLGKAFKKAGRLGLAKRVDYVCSGKYNFDTRE
jgi:hypothetical protein